MKLIILHTVLKKIVVKIELTHTEKSIHFLLRTQTENVSFK